MRSALSQSPQIDSVPPFGNEICFILAKYDETDLSLFCLLAVACMPTGRYDSRCLQCMFKRDPNQSSKKDLPLFFYIYMFKRDLF